MSETNGQLLAYYPSDGYTESRGIHGVPNLHPAVEFEYRPMTVEQRAQYLSQWHTTKPGPKREVLQAGYLKAHLKQWNVNGADGSILPITPATILTLKYAVYDRLATIVLLGTEAGDYIPGATTEQKAETVDAELEAAMEGRPYADVAAEGHEKN